MDQPIKIHPAWDAALTYEDRMPADNAASGPVFVGRSDLLDIIVGAIRQPDRRGTFLVSGYRGGAFEADRTNITQGQFVWKRNAAHSFRFLRRLERHETALVDRLEKLQAAMKVFATGGPLADLAGVRNGADAFLHDLEDPKQTVQTTDHTLTVDDTDKQDLLWQRRAAEPITRAYRAHLDRVVNRYGLQFEPIGSSVEGGTLSLLRAPFGDPRSQEGQLGAAVLLAQGEGGRLDDDVREFVGRAPGLRRLAIVHVMHAPGESTALAAREEQWRRQLADEMQQTVADGRPRALVVQALALDEGWPEDALVDCWGDKLAERLLFHTGWAGLAVEKYIVSHDVAPIMASVNDRPDHRPVVAAITEWLRGQQRVLHVLLDGSSPHDPGIICLAALAGIDTPEVIGYGLGSEEPVPLKVLSEKVQVTVGSGQDKDSRVPVVVARLVEQCEIIPVVVTTGQKPPSDQWLIELLGNQGRAIVIAPSSWRPLGADGAELTFTTLRIEESPAAKA